MPDFTAILRGAASAEQEVDKEGLPGKTVLALAEALSATQIAIEEEFSDEGYHSPEVPEALEASEQQSTPRCVYPRFKRNIQLTNCTAVPLHVQKSS